MTMLIVSCKIALFAFALIIGTILQAQGVNPNPEPLPADEITPVSVRFEGEVYSNDYAVEKMIDRRLDGYACLNDESRTGSRADTVPPNADLPVTARLVFDLGEAAKTVGIRMVSRNDWPTMAPKNVSVYAADDETGSVNLRPLAENVPLSPVNRAFSAFVRWPQTTARYIVLHVNDAYQMRERRQPKVYAGTYYNTQIAEVSFLRRLPDDFAEPNPPDLAFPTARLHRDWILQDTDLDPWRVFTSSDSFEAENAMVERVLAELAEYEADEWESLTAEKPRLTAENAPGNDPRWKALYFNACHARRRARFGDFSQEVKQILFVTHYVQGGTEGLTGMPALSDEQHYDATTERRVGSRLSLLTLADDGSVACETLLEKPNGVIRDPALSFDALTLVFAMRENFESDDYHLYKMNLADRAVTQLTFSPTIDGKLRTVADFEPCFIPGGKLVFSSTRHTQINDCWPNANTNLYACDGDGKNVRRLTFDELDVNYPQLLDDGRVLFTRWEYSDRNAFYLHPLMTMNPDGSTQTEFCGNNSMYPASYIQARGIPHSTKAIAIISGHHIYHKGKLALIDRTLGTQNGECIEYVAGSSPDGTPGRKKSDIKPEGHFDGQYDYFAQGGPQYQYPFALDEENYLVAMMPDNPIPIDNHDLRVLDGPFLPAFGIYWTDADGRRELLAYDPTISSGQPIPIRARDEPPLRSTSTDLTKSFGTCVVQDVYLGPGLAGVSRGTVKRLRVVALEYRAAKMGKGTNSGEVATGLVQTPISFNNGSWDVKHVLGEVPVEEDGSCAFLVPARTPIYFQLLDENGFCVQTMRSWATLQPGETFACLGCHENKTQTGAMEANRPAPLALNRPPRVPEPLGKAHPLLEKLQTEKALESVENYFGVNAPALDADPEAACAGFSYRQNIQPILDRHCVSCHSATSDAPDDKRSTFLLTGEYVPVEDQKVSPDDDYKRSFTRSYLTLTNNGKVEENKYLSWIETRSRSAMLPPYYAGASKSKIFDYLSPSHYGVNVSETERRIFACWIDLLIPFCGSYTDANRWTDAEKVEYLRFVEKRRSLANAEREEILAKLISDNLDK